MASYAMCSRDSMYPSHPKHSTETTLAAAQPSAPVDPEKESSEVATKGKKGNRNKKKWQKLSLEPDEPAYCVWTEADLAFPDYPSEAEASQARATATWTALSATPAALLECPALPTWGTQTTAPTPSNPSPASSHLDDLQELAQPADPAGPPKTATGPTKPPNKRRRNNRKKSKMATTNEVKVASSVPAHLRFRKSATPGAHVTDHPKGEQDATKGPESAQRECNPPKPKVPKSAYTPPHLRQSNSPTPKVPASALVPPHLRKHSSTNSQPASAGASSAATKVTPDTAVAKSTPESAEQKKMASKITDLAREISKSPMSEARSSPATPTAVPKSAQSTPSSAAASKQNGKAASTAKPEPSSSIWQVPPSQPTNNLQASQHAPQSRNGRPGWKRQPHPKYIWPKNRDMKPLPVEEDEDEDGGVPCPSDSNGDEFYDVRKLVGWDGNWNPAPLERGPGFVDRHFDARMDAWLNNVPLPDWMHKSSYHDIKNSTVQLPKGDANTASKVSGVLAAAARNNAIAPEYWLPKSINAKAPQDFWRDLKTCAPAPLSDIDLSEQPWWEEYQDGSVVFLKPFEVPDAMVDPDVEENRHPGCKTTAEEVVRHKAEARKAREQKIMAKRNRRPLAYSEPSVEPMPDRTLKPKVNIYLRPVSPADTTQITEIFNYYIAETITACEFNPRTIPQIAARLNNTITEGLPWIVAVLRSNNHHNNFRGRARQPTCVNEKIVGFASLDDHTHVGSMWRYTLELEIYVHHQFRNKGVGSCLLDKLLSMVSPSYGVRGGYNWHVNGDYLKIAPSRYAKVINFGYPHEHHPRDGKDEELAAVNTLMKNFDFHKRGRLPNMGAKYGKMVDLTIFQHETTEPVDPNKAPTDPL